MADFHSFVVFAEMRTGSNFLEANINAFDGLTCHGEAFNPHFIGYPYRKDILGLTQKMRDGDPHRLLEVIQNAPGDMGGFRYFNNHDPRVRDAIIDDPRCAKIILTRNPVESYVSLKIAGATGQWKLTNVKHAKSQKIRFDEAEFNAHLSDVQGFQIMLLNRLQKSGQTAFYVDYEDLQDVDVMNGLAKWLGCDAQIEQLDKKLKKQNPEPLASKVHNYDAMELALAQLDRFNLSRTPNFEPRRGPAVPTYLAAGQLLFMPVRSGPEQAVTDWLQALMGEDALVSGLTQKTLRQWRGLNPVHRSFTVVRHPVARAHAAYCDKILATGAGTFAGIRDTLRKSFDLPLPEGDVDASYTDTLHQQAFKIWLRFLKANLAGQTAVRVDPAWASQTTVLQGFGTFATPDAVLREADLSAQLTALAATVGHTGPCPAMGATDPHANRLSAVYDPEIEALAHEIYARDYESLGFQSWG